MDERQWTWPESMGEKEYYWEDANGQFLDNVPEFREGDSFCAVYTPNANRWICTRSKGHLGRHVAHYTTNKVLCIWGEDVPPRIPKSQILQELDRILLP